MSRLSARLLAPLGAVVIVLGAAPLLRAQVSPAAAPPAPAQPVPPQPAAAQTAGPRVLSLDEALALAEARNESVLIAESSVRRARGAEAQVRSQRLPQLTGTASYDRTLKSEFEGIFDADSFGNGNGSGDDNAFADLPFGQPNAY